MVTRSLFLLLLVLAACAPAESGDGGCAPLWCACPGQEPYQVAESACDLEQEVAGGFRYYSYYNCPLGQRTPTLNVGVECTLSFGY